MRVLIAVDGRPLEDSSDLRNAIGLARVGSEVKITLLREGRETDVTVRLVAGATGSRVEQGALAQALAGAAFGE